MTVRGQSSKPCPKARSFGVSMGTRCRVWLRHRRSHRHPAAAFTSVDASTWPKPCSGAPLVSAKPRLFAYPVPDLKRSLSSCPSSALNRDPSSQSFTLPVLRASLRRSVLPWAETFGMTSLDKHVDSCQRGFRFTKRFRFSALRLIFVGVFCSEDKVKLRSNLCFGKAGKSQLSTFPRISCGQQWTTQQFIALDTFEREPTGLARVCTAIEWQVAHSKCFAIQNRPFAVSNR